eukprot:TRINITY_DN831_c0_g1_i1.p1 TRINITY_DN831_c0_g1~~TRINITY_DN831_c0_g1_i1.p1  ORF type:complete len:400 (-),score=91.32 TRINITY_DN831_c0_g1_i1:27-1226(-)
MDFYQELIDLNPFYLFLSATRDQFENQPKFYDDIHDLLSMAIRNNYIILIPDTRYLVGVKFHNLEFIKSHLITKSRIFYDEYITANGKILHIDENTHVLTADSISRREVKRFPGRKQVFLPHGAIPCRLISKPIIDDYHEFNRNLFENRSNLFNIDRFLKKWSVNEPIIETFNQKLLVFQDDMSVISSEKGSAQYLHRICQQTLDKLCERNPDYKMWVSTSDALNGDLHLTLLTYSLLKCPSFFNQLDRRCQQMNLVLEMACIKMPLPEELESYPDVSDLARLFLDLKKESILEKYAALKKFGEKIQGIELLDEDNNIIPITGDHIVPLCECVLLSLGKICNETNEEFPHIYSNMEYIRQFILKPPEGVLSGEIEHVLIDILAASNKLKTYYQTNVYHK